jgi:hypothetical protein
MTALSRVRIVLSGFPGGPGVATHYVHDAATALGELKGLWAAFAQVMPTDVFITYPTAGDVIEDTTGGLTGSWTAPGRSGDVGATSGTYSAPSGAVVTWTTGAVFDKHRLRGRTFVVPIGGSQYDADGSLSAACIAALSAAAGEKVGTLAGNLVIWHRPIHATLAGPPERLGASSAVTGFSVRDRVAVLRSRRL